MSRFAGTVGSAPQSRGATSARSCPYNETLTKFVNVARRALFQSSQGTRGRFCGWLGLGPETPDAKPREKTCKTCCAMCLNGQREARSFPLIDALQGG